LTIALDLPKLRSDQSAIVTDPSKIKILAMGRRWGKTVTGGVVTLNVLRQHGRAAWIVPAYKNGRSLWRYAAGVCAPLAQAGYMSISKSERVITTFAGGFFGIYSAENIDSIRSEAFNLVVGDEAARIAEEGWQDAVRPTLADADGDEILISTPKGKNWFYYEFMRGQSKSDGYMSWTAPSSSNPMPQIKHAYDLARTRVPERTFKQEWNAEFVDDGVIFRNIEKLAILKPQEPQEGHEYIIGVDWGRTNDATVFCVIDIAEKKQVCLDRMTNTDYASQRLRLKSLVQRYNNASVLAELNSMGAPNVEALQGMDIQVTGFNTTNASKAEIIQALELAFENEDISILDDTVQKVELMAYEAIRSSTGLIRYSAPEGMHDDTVIALALAWSGANSDNWYMI
jgi:phage terminase large subunit-like protein